MNEPNWYRTMWWYAVLADEPAWPTPATVTVGLTAHGHAVSGGSAMLLSAVALTAHGHAVSGGSATLTA